MFGRRARIRELEVENAIMKLALDDAIKTCENMRNLAYLIAIQREERSNKFVFMRNDELITIETMGLISDDVAAWKKDLL